MKKLLSLSLMFSLGLATVTPTLNAVAESQQDVVAQSQANPANVSGWQAAKKWWRSGRNMKALSRQEKKAFKALKRKFAIGAIIAAMVALIGGGAALAIDYKKRQEEQEEQQERAWAAAVAADRAAARAARHAAWHAGRPADEAAAADKLGKELKVAVLNRDKEDVEWLIAAGADVNARDRYEATALMFAAGSGNADIVKLLLGAEANVNAADQHESTALMSAANRGHENIVELLLQIDGIDVNAADRYGDTALMIAAFPDNRSQMGYRCREIVPSQGHADIVQRLLDVGADKTIKNNDGQTAEDLARENDDDEIADIIRDYGSGRRTKRAKVEDK